MIVDKRTILVAILGILGAIVFFSQFPIFSPQASLDLKLTRPDIIQKARDFLDEMNYDTSELDADANFLFDSGIAIYLEYEHGLAKAHDILRADSLAAHRWYLTFFDRSLPPSQMPQSFDVWISPGGQMLGFRRTIPDSLTLPSLNEDEALGLS